MVNILANVFSHSQHFNRGAVPVHLSHRGVDAEILSCDRQFKDAYRRVFKYAAVVHLGIDKGLFQAGLFSNLLGQERLVMTEQLSLLGEPQLMLNPGNNLICRAGFNHIVGCTSLKSRNLLMGLI
jgi:hypothetical protein